MIIWWIIGSISLILLLLNSALSKPSRHGNFAWVISQFVFFFLSFLLAMRGDFGVDWKSYIDFYSNIPSFPSLISEGGWMDFNIEPGYQIYMSLLKFFNLNHNFLPVFLFMISFVMVMQGCKIWRVSPLAMTAIITLLIYPHYYGQIRMAFVYTLGILVGLAILNQNRKVVLLTTILAASVQYIGLAYFFTLILPNFNVTSHPLRPLWFTGNFSIKKRTFIVATFLFLFFSAYHFSELFLSSLIQILPLYENPITEKLIIYHSMSERIDRSFVGIFIIASLASTIIFLINREPPANKIILTAAATSLLAAVTIFLLTESFPILAQRIYSMILIPSFAILLSFVSLRSKNNILYIVICSYAGYLFLNVTLAIGPYNF
jgi:hypothetical protein